MGLQTLLPHGQLAGCILAVVLSLCLLVPMIVHEISFQGHCILFSNGSRNDTGNLVVSWASIFPCIYSLVVGLLLMLTSAFQGYRVATQIRYGSEGNFASSFTHFIANMIMTVMVLIAAIITTLGFKSWCDTIISGYQSCAGASVQGIDKQDLETLSGFYLQIGTAQFGAWSSWVCCVALTLCTVLQSCWYHQQQNLKVSMAKERQRLLDSDQPILT